MELWRYGAFAFAIAATLCLAAANVAWAWSLPDGVHRYVMIVVAIGADVGAPCALMAMMHHQSRRDAVSALASFVIWAACGYAEVHGAKVWLRSNSFAIEAPAAKATEAQQTARENLEEEKRNLAEIRKNLNAARRRSVRADLLSREAASLRRIGELQPMTFTALASAPAKSQYVGNEMALAFALWLLSQLAWRMAVGQLHGPLPRTQTWGGDDLSEEPLSGGLVINGRAIPDSARQAARHALSGQPDSPVRTASDTGPDSPPDRPSGDGHHLVRKGKDTVRSQTRTADRTRLSVVRTDAAGQQTAPDSSGQQIPDSSGQPSSDLEQRVSDYASAGFSIRQIVEETGAKKWRVEELLKKIRAASTTASRG